MADSHPSIFTFTTDIPGTEVEVTVSVKSLLATPWRHSRLNSPES